MRGERVAPSRANSTWKSLERTILHACAKSTKLLVTEKRTKVPESEPRNYLVEPSNFGHDAKALWKPIKPSDRARVGAAFYQHSVVIKARKRLVPSGFANVAQFGNLLADPQGLTKKFVGSRRAQMDDYLMWAYHLGRAILVTWERRTTRDLLFPDHLVARVGESQHEASGANREAQRG